MCFQADCIIRVELQNVCIIYCNVEISENKNRLFMCFDNNNPELETLFHSIWLLFICKWGNETVNK
jgi:hypothetical protein